MSKPFKLHLYIALSDSSRLMGQRLSTFHIVSAVQLNISIFFPKPKRIWLYCRGSDQSILLFLKSYRVF